MPLNQTQIDFLKKHIDKITLHWSGGSHTTLSGKYHFCIQFINGDAKVVQTLSLYELGEHTWQRNTGNIGISMLGMASIKYPIMPEQIEACAKLVAELMFVLGIEEDMVQDHYHYAKLDGYTHLRWDVGFEGAKWNGKEVNLKPIIKKKAAWYLSKLKTGEIKREYTANLK